MLPGLLLAPLNRLLRAEDWARVLLQAHAGKGAQIQLGALDLCCLIGADGQLAALPPDQTPAVRISLPAQALGELLGGAAPGGPGSFPDSFPEALIARAQIHGDAGLADALSRLIRHLRPDLGAALSPVLGPALAHRAEQFAGTAFATLQDTARRLSANLREYLAEGVAPAITRPELAAHAEASRQLAERLARLEARIHRRA